jgi:4-hydroxybenzoate polyprenyltransferase
MTPIAPWWVLLAIRLFSFAMLAIALERAAGAIWKAVRPITPVWRPLWRATKDGEKISFTVSLLRVQAEVAPIEIGLSLGRSAAIAVSLGGLLFGLLVLSGWSSVTREPPLAPIHLVLYGSLSTLGVALGWVSPTARARELAELRPTLRSVGEGA